MTRRNRILAGLLCAAAFTGVSAWPAMAQTAGTPLRIGVLTDMTGFTSYNSGAGSVTATQMAVEDFGGTVLGRKIEVVSGDNQNKPDVGAATARQWFDTGGVDAIVDLAGSAIALAVQEVAREKQKVLMFTSAATPDLTGKACSPYGVAWAYDTYALATVTARAVTQSGGKSWFFVTSDFAFGRALERDASAVVKALGGTVKGFARHPMSNNDFGSFLLQAQASGADVVGLANGSMDTVNSIKQAREFGLTSKQRIAALLLFVTDVHALGLNAAQDVLLTEAFYWDQNEETRAFSKRYFERRNAMPNMAQAGAYSATLHYLKAVQKAGTTEGPKVMEAMRSIPINDFMTKNGTIRDDMRMMRDMYLFRVKKPAESKYPWDYYEQVATIKADDAFRPLAESECPLVKKK